jgi:hypothetical protein
LVSTTQIDDPVDPRVHLDRHERGVAIVVELGEHVRDESNEEIERFATPRCVAVIEVDTIREEHAVPARVRQGEVAIRLAAGPERAERVVVSDLGGDECLVGVGR